MCKAALKFGHKKAHIHVLVKPPHCPGRLQFVIALSWFPPSVTILPIYEHVSQFTLLLVIATCSLLCCCASSSSVNE